MLRWLKNRLQAEPSAPRAGAGLPAQPDTKAPAQAKFKLEALEPRLLLSGDTPLLAEAYRAMVADEANAASLPQEIHFQQLDAATRDEISAARQGSDSAAGAASTGVSVAWGQGWASSETAQTGASVSSDSVTGGVGDTQPMSLATRAEAADDTRLSTQSSYAAADSDQPPADAAPANAGPGASQDLITDTFPKVPPARGPPPAVDAALVLALQDRQYDELLPSSPTPPADPMQQVAAQQMLDFGPVGSVFARGPPADGLLTLSAIAPVLAQATDLWSSVGLTRVLADRLAGIHVAVAVLPDGLLRGACFLVGRVQQPLDRLDVGRDVPRTHCPADVPDRGLQSHGTGCRAAGLRGEVRRRDEGP